VNLGTTPACPPKRSLAPQKARKTWPAAAVLMIAVRIRLIARGLLLVLGLSALARLFN
jgi:hypothetical protein